MIHVRELLCHCWGYKRCVHNFCLKPGQEGYTGYLGAGGRIILKRIVQAWDKTNRTDMGSRGGGLALSGLGEGLVGGFFFE